MQPCSVRSPLTGAIAALWLLCPSVAVGQILPDRSLPENSRVTPEGNVLTIEGGTRAGNNLFHSFEQFDVPSDTRAYFNNALDLGNILTRVTGSSISQIDGAIATNGTANLFLLNPNGIVFGPEASLDIGGSFFASSGDTIQFANGDTFGASTANAEPILSVSVPVGLGFGSTSGSIVNQSRADTVGLRVEAGNEIGLFGRTIELNGGYLSAPEGRIELSGDRIQLSQQAIVDTSGTGGGEIVVNGDLVILKERSRLLANTLGDGTGTGITLDADRLGFYEGSFASASTLASGDAGNLTVTASTIDLDGDGQLQAILDELFAGTLSDPAQIGSGLLSTSFGDGDGGQIAIATDSLNLHNGAFVTTISTAGGHSGSVAIDAAESVNLVESQLSADSGGSGDAGRIRVETQTLHASQGGGIFASSFGSGQVGTLDIRATDRVESIGTTPDGRFKSGIFTNIFSEATGNTGEVAISTRRLLIRDGAGVGAITLGSVPGGTVTVNATESVEVLGTSADGRELSTIVTQSLATGAAGDITINTRRLVVRGGAEISTATFDAGAAGRLSVQASESVEIEGRSANGTERSQLRSDASLSRPPSGFLPPSNPDAVGAAGDVTIQTERFAVRDGGLVAVSSSSAGERAGNLRIAADSIQIANNSDIKAEPAAVSGGNIFLQARSIVLRGESNVTTNALADATGGNIEIETDTLVALDNSDISANAERGFGGRAIVDARGLFGIQFRPVPTPQSDITASSELGADFRGVVEVRAPDIRLDTALAELSAEFVPTERLTADSCLSPDSALAGSFTMSGTGGLPTSPYQFLRIPYDLSEMRDLPLDGNDSDLEARPNPRRSWQLGDPIREAGGITILENGSMQLIAPSEPPILHPASDLLCDPVG